MSQILSKKFSLLDMEPSKLVMTQIDEMFRDLFSGLRSSAIGGENSSLIQLDSTEFSAGDLLYLPDATGVLDGLAIGSSAGAFLRTDGSLPEWSTLILPNAATTGDILYANTTDTIATLADVATGKALISGGVGVAPSWGQIGLTTHVTGTLPLGNGGTGLSVVASGSIIRSTGSAFTALAPGTSNRFLQGVGSTLVWSASNYALPQTITAGDLLYASSTTVVTVLNIGTAGKVTRSNGTSPAWSTFTIPDTFAQGDLLYSSAANVLTALAKNASSTRYLSNTGTSNNPAWAQVDLTNGVTGTLPVGNGGTGLTSWTANGIVYASGSSTLTNGSVLAFNGTSTLSLVAATAARISVDITTETSFDEFLFKCNGTNKWSFGAYGDTGTYPNLFYVWQYTDSSDASVNQPRLIIDETGLIGIGNVSGNFPSAGANGIVFPHGSAALSGMGSNTAGIYGEDDGDGTTRMYGINEDDTGGPIALVATKTSTGDGTGHAGLFQINTADNTFKVYAEGAWRTLATW